MHISKLLLKAGKPKNTPVPIKATTGFKMPKIPPIATPKKPIIVDAPCWNNENEDLGCKIVQASPRLSEIMDKVKVPIAWEKHVKLFNQKAWLLRNETKNLKNFIVDNYIYIDGKHNSGKSGECLALMDYLLNENDWVILYSPQMFRWTDGWYPYFPVKSNKDEVPKEFEQPTLAIEFLQAQMAINEKIFNEIIATSIEEMPNVEGQTLSEICKIGIEDETKAHPAIKLLLTTLANQEKFPVLNIMDEANALHLSKISYNNVDSTPLKPENLLRQCIEAKGTKVFLQVTSYYQEGLLHNNLKPLFFLLTHMGKEKISAKNTDYWLELNDSLFLQENHLSLLEPLFRDIENTYLGQINEVVNKRDLLESIIAEKLTALSENRNANPLNEQKLKTLMAKYLRTLNCDERSLNVYEQVHPNEKNVFMYKPAPLEFAEAKELLRFYKQKGLIYPTTISDEYIEKKLFVTGRSIGDIYVDCSGEELFASLGQMEFLTQ
ncbi:hypothetical protein O9G_000578 [Rozella allomycis CSF55]|uniref:Small ribosomal subunit protein mS29 n=1 Tax=Rozella allomycis (strain CSF55) TaxID=988480 RepID=A0A075B0P3_ROZAC|nr:hypothetical protein O9G_000578 [Rozella allomycis CSF55]|eukprot:EPZ34391.1 hypothetical protein O9G_000578 [Rozella allomycis CSF55]